MSISVQLDEDQSRRLSDVAMELNVDPSDMAKAAINDLVPRPADDFERAARLVLEKTANFIGA